MKLCSGYDCNVRWTTSCGIPLHPDKVQRRCRKIVALDQGCCLLVSEGLNRVLKEKRQVVRKPHRSAVFCKTVIVSCFAEGRHAIHRKV